MRPDAERSSTYRISASIAPIAQGYNLKSRTIFVWSGLLF